MFVFEIAVSRDTPPSLHEINALTHDKPVDGVPTRRRLIMRTQPHLCSGRAPLDDRLS